MRMHRNQCPKLIIYRITAVIVYIINVIGTDLHFNIIDIFNFQTIVTQLLLDCYSIVTHCWI